MKLRHWLPLMAALLLAVLCGAAMADGSCGNNVTWTLSGDGTLTLRGSGPTWDYRETSEPSPFLNNLSVKSVVFVGDVNYIGDFLFKGCTQLSSVTFPERLTTIGIHAFEGCTKLGWVTLPEDLEEIGEAAFFGCSSLSTVSFRYKLESIGVAAFMNCSNLTRAWIPDSVEFLGKQAFSGCMMLETVRLPNRLTVIGESAFCDCVSLTEVVIPASVTNIGMSAFYNNAALTRVTVYGKSTVFGNQAFYQIPTAAFFHGWSGSTAQTAASVYSCHFAALTASGSCGGGVTWSFNPANGELLIAGTGRMPYYYTEECPWYDFQSAVRTLRVSEGVENVAPANFSACINLTTVYLPASVTEISSNFYGCFAIMNYAVDGSNPVYRSIDGVLYSRDGKTLFNFPAGRTGSYTVPAGTTAIAASAFQDASLSGITLPASVTFLGDGAFSGCSNLGVFDIPEGVTEVGNSLLSGCERLTFVTIPASVNRIGPFAFQGCVRLGPGLLLPEGLTRIDYQAFAGCRSLRYLNLPAGMQSIESEAFAGCRQLERLEIPCGLTAIGDSAFSGAAGLVDVYILNPNTAIGTSAFEPNTVSLCIHGWIGSTADTFADANGILFDGWALSGQCGDQVTWSIDPASMSLNIAGTGPMWDYPDVEDPGWYPVRWLITSVNVGSGVTGIGSYAFRWMEALHSVSLPASLKTIGEYAFWRDPELYAIQIPSGVTAIGSGIFADCDSLADDDGFVIFRNVLYHYNGIGSVVTVPAGVTEISGSAFMAVDYMTRVILPAGLKSIREYAFYECYDLTDVVIPEGVTLIDRCAFCWCTSLTGITLPESVAVIGNGAFTQADAETSVLSEVTILNPLAQIGEDVFIRHGEGLTIHGWQGSTAEAYAAANSIAFQALPNGGQCGDSVFWKLEGNTLVFYGTGAMYDYEQFDRAWFALYEDITAAEFRDGVTGIGNYACGMLSRLTDVTMADSVTAVGPNAFRNCGMLTGLTVGKGVTSVGNFAFYGDRSLETLSVAAGNTAFRAEDGILFTADMKELVCRPPAKAGTAYTVPDGVQTVRTTAFATSQSLRRVILPDSVTAVNLSAFIGSQMLEDVTFEGSAPAFMANTFYGVTVKAFIPAGDSSWTDGVKQNYGGTVIWIAIDAPDFFLPAALTAIEADAFTGIAAKGVVIPQSVTDIGGDPFAGSGVTTVYGFPGSAAESLASLGGYAFYPIDSDWIAAH